MKFHSSFVIFEKAANCCHLLQIIGGALWVKIYDQEKFSSSCVVFVVVFVFNVPTKAKVI